MAIGKGKRKGKGGQNKKKVSDPFLKKEWYDVRAPAMFTNRNVGKSFVNKTAGKSIASDNLKGRVFGVSLADLNRNEDQAFRIIKLRVEDVQGKTLMTNFHGMDFTTDKLKSLVRKWQTLIETSVEVKTTDGYSLRLFCIGFTKKRPNQLKKHCYCKSSQARSIRKKMGDIIVRESANCDMKQLFEKFVPESIGKQIERECHGIYPLQNVYIWKAKVLKKPKTDLGRLMDLHASTTPEDTGETITNAFDTKPPEATPEQAQQPAEAAQVVGEVKKEEQPTTDKPQS